MVDERRTTLILTLVMLLLSVGSLWAADATEHIKVFFNQPESDTYPSRSRIANPDKGIDDALVEFFQTAGSGDKVYICFYSSTTAKVTSAINSAASAVGAANIYHIMEEAEGNSKNGTVDDPGIYAFANSIDDGSNGYPLMHNKFAVVINSALQEGRVWTGSYNPTENGTEKNNNNAVWIESFELAEIFEDEFLYMWNGGAGKFSIDKATSPATGKSVTVDGCRITAYFAPYTAASDNTSMVLEDLIDDSAYSLFFEMYSFSAQETRIVQALKDAHDDGIEIKGVLEASQSSAVQSELRDYGINAVLDANEDSLHSKYCVIDYGSSSPVTVTGSYNWTLSARDTNDENFLVIKSAEVAKLYWEEFQKDFALAGGSDEDKSREAVSDVLIYPSPAENTSSVTIGYTLSAAVKSVEIKVYTVSGERVVRLEPDFYAGTYNEKVWDMENSAGKDIAPGLYMVKVEAETADGIFHDIEKFAVIK